jgi:hypothetical protein
VGFCVSCVLPGAVVVASPVRAADDDEIVIIDDEGVSAGDDGVIRFGDDDDDTIVILDEGEAPTPAPSDAPTGPLGRIWDAWHLALDSEVYVAAQMTDAENGPLRALGSVMLESWLLPAPNLSFYGTGFARLAWDGTPTGRLVPFADVYELYAKITLDRATVQLGRLAVPWGRTLGAGFGDRLHPPDLRRGPPFPDPARQKQPQHGVQLKGSVGVVGVEAVGFFSFEPSEGPLTAANQGGVRIGRYQTALARSPTLAGGLLESDDTSRVRPKPALMQPTLAARAWRRVGEIDITASAAWHFDETPTLHLADDVARVVAAEGLALRGLPAGAPLVACDTPGGVTCLGAGALTHGQTTSVAVDASWGLGLVVARAESVLYPRVGLLPGKTALILDASGVRSIQVGQLATAVAVEGQLGPAIDGSLELLHVAWDGVPGDARLWGVEVLESDDGADATALRMVHRLAVAAHLGGTLFDERVDWRLRGEAGLLQADVLASAEVRYRLPVFDLYLGGRGDVFTGRPGSPGWMRQEATQIGIFVGEGS